MLRISTKLQQHSFHRGTALSALDDNSIQYGIRKLRTSVNRWEIKFLLDDNQKQSGVRKLLGNCSRIKFTRHEGRGGGGGGKFQSKGIGTVQQKQHSCAHTVSGFQLRATSAVSRENCTAGYAVSRNTVAKISRVFYRAFLHPYIPVSLGRSDSQPGRYTL